MLNKEDIIKILNESDIFADNFILDAFIKNWKIEAIYEDENGVEYFDEPALVKIKNALGNKEPKQELYTVETIEKEQTQPEAVFESIEASEEHDNEEVLTEKTQDKPVVNPDIQVVENIPESAEVIENVSGSELCVFPSAELKNVTLDLTNQTLGVLAQAIAEKLTVDVSDYLKRTEWVEEAMNLGSFKKDNEIMASKINELLRDNKVLIKRIQELENENNRYVSVFGNIYVKKPK